MVHMPPSPSLKVAVFTFYDCPVPDVVRSKYAGPSADFSTSRSLLPVTIEARVEQCCVLCACVLLDLFSVSSQSILEPNI